MFITQNEIDDLVAQVVAKCNEVGQTVEGKAFGNYEEIPDFRQKLGNCIQQAVNDFAQGHSTITVRARLRPRVRNELRLPAGVWLLVASILWQIVFEWWKAHHRGSDWNV